MNRIKERTDKLEDLFNTINGLADILMEDLIAADSEDKPLLNGRHRGAVIRAIDELTWRGYEHLEVIDQEAAS